MTDKSDGTGLRSQEDRFKKPGRSVVMGFPKIPEKAIPLIILLAVIGAVLFFNNSAEPDQPSGNSLAVSGKGTEKTSDPGEAVVETLSGSDAQSDQALDAEEKTLEKRVAEALAKIAGVGKVDVTISFASGIVRHYVYEENNTERTQRETDAQGGTRDTTEKANSNKVVISGSEPVLEQLERAKIAGVLVVVEGGQDATILTRVRDCVKTLLGIEAAKVWVEPMAK